MNKQERDSLSEFEADVSQFLTMYSAHIDQKDKRFILANQQPLFALYQEVLAKGGFIRYYSESKDWLPEAGAKIRGVYSKYFLSFEYYQQKKLKCFMDHSLIDKARHIDMDEYLHTGELGIRDNQINVLHLDATTLERLKTGMFTAESIRKHHGSQKVDIRVQTVKDTGLPTRIPQYQLSLTINEYLDYQENPAEFIQNLIEQGHMDITKDTILFAVNIDMNQWPRETNALRELFPEISFGQKHDGLSYLRQHILGITLPQVYMKVKDVYTGGHQEHLGVNAVNINNGPGCSQWISVDAQYVPQVRELVQKEAGIDITVDEGLWYRDADYFIQNKIPVKYTVQRPGDIIILGPGCLHLVKSEGICIQTAWNYMEKILSTAQTMSERYRQNRLSNYQTVIPIKSLWLDLLNHEGSVLEPEFAKFLKTELGQFWDQEKAIVDNLLVKLQARIRMTEYDETSFQITLCSGCWHEIFMYYYLVEGPKQGGEYDFYCVDCMEQEIMKLTKRQATIRHKYKAGVLRQLIGSRVLPSCMENLCFSNYIGSVACTRMFTRDKAHSLRSLEQIPDVETSQEKVVLQEQGSLSQKLQQPKGKRQNISDKDKQQDGGRNEMLQEQLPEKVHDQGQQKKEQQMMHQDKNPVEEQEQENEQKTEELKDREMQDEFQEQKAEQVMEEKEIQKKQQKTGLEIEQEEENKDPEGKHAMEKPTETDENDRNKEKCNADYNGNEPKSSLEEQGKKPNGEKPRQEPKRFQAIPKEELLRIKKSKLYRLPKMDRRIIADEGSNGRDEMAKRQARVQPPKKKVIVQDMLETEVPENEQVPIKKKVKTDTGHEPQPENAPFTNF